MASTNKSIKLSTSSTSSSSSSIPPMVLDTTESKDSLNNWIAKMYDVTDVSDEVLKSMYESFAYKGFNRDNVLKQMHIITKDDKRLFVELVIVVALRGPQAASTIKLYNNKTARDLLIPASGGKGSRGISLNKIQAATADLAAFFLKKLNVPKRLNVDCPAWLQFPAAGSIKMPSAIRAQHIEFSKQFSIKIGGAFNEDIYNQMEINSYIDDKLKLF